MTDRPVLAPTRVQIGIRPELTSHYTVCTFLTLDFTFDAKAGSNYS